MHSGYLCSVKLTEQWWCLNRPFVMQDVSADVRRPPRALEVWFWSVSQTHVWNAIYYPLKSDRSRLFLLVSSHLNCRRNHDSETDERHTISESKPEERTEKMYDRWTQCTVVVKQLWMVHIEVFTRNKDFGTRLITKILTLSFWNLECPEWKKYCGF